MNKSYSIDKFKNNINNNNNMKIKDTLKGSKLNEQIKVRT